MDNLSTTYSAQIVRTNLHGSGPRLPPCLLPRLLESALLCMGRRVACIWIRKSCLHVCLCLQTLTLTSCGRSAFWYGIVGGIA
ncbi:hypothetical protein BJX64DRAFT_249635 [Aspergillus heterothallicus]